MNGPQRTETERTPERVIGWITTKPIEDEKGYVFATGKQYEVITVGKFSNGKRFYETNEVYERHENFMVEHLIIVEDLVDEWDPVPCVSCGSPAETSRLNYPVCNLCRTRFNPYSHGTIERK